MKPQWNNLRTHPPSKRLTNSQTVKSSPLETLDSDAQNICSSPSKWTAENSTPFKTWPTNPSKNAMLTSEETSIWTSFFQEEPPCSKESVKDFLRKSNPEHLNQSTSRLLPAQTEDSLSGEEDPLWPHCPPSPACGSPRKTMMNMVQPLSTENAFEHSECHVEYNY